MITGHQDLRDLFVKHCTCRPIDFTRSLADHGPDCIVEVLADVQLLLGPPAEDTAQCRQERYEAVKRCDRYQQGDYSVLGTVH